jgi:iron(III) transport system permease protein
VIRLGHRWEGVWGGRVSRLRVNLTPWTLATLGVVSLVLLPLFAIFWGVLGETSDTWAHLASTVLGSYVRNSLLLSLGVGLATLVIGVSTAWLVTACDFPGRRIFEWALILPLAIPTYVIAFTYAELLAHTGPLQTALQTVFAAERTAQIRVAFMSVTGAGMMMTLVLYPYVYLITRTSFLKQSGGFLETSRILGKSAWATFFRVALPMARPGIVAGLTLVLMEVLNEYGAVRYFGVPTFTTGIFRAWFSLGDGPAAVRLAGALLILVFTLVLVERLQRGRARFGDPAGRSRPLVPYRLSGARAVLAFGVCLTPLFLGFLLPVFQLLVWAVSVAPELMDPRFLRLTLNSFGLAWVTAFLVVALALLIVYSTRLSPTPFLRLASRAAGLGYSIPGAVIAVGMLIPLLWVDRRLMGFLEPLLGRNPGLLLTGTLLALVLAYAVRFLAVALSPTDSGFERVCGKMDEAARSLGLPPRWALLRVNLPLLRGTLLSAGLLVFVDVLKELPLTLILRPFNFDTLATRAFQLASDEQVARSALPALIIIAVGMIPVALLSRIIARDRG